MDHSEILHCVLMSQSPFCVLPFSPDSTDCDKEWPNKNKQYIVFVGTFATFITVHFTVDKIVLLQGYVMIWILHLRLC